MKIIECPRDAMQGIEPFIPTSQKVEYIDMLLQVGFDTIDFGSFVSPKAVPQMKDTAEVVERLTIGNSPTKLLAIVANIRGARRNIEQPSRAVLVVMIAGRSQRRLNQPRCVCNLPEQESGFQS